MIVPDHSERRPYYQGEKRDRKHQPPESSLIGHFLRSTSKILHIFEISLVQNFILGHLYIRDLKSFWFIPSKNF